MDLKIIDPPRIYEVGTGNTIKDCGHVKLEPDEQITFLTDSGGQYDVTRKFWGFYATPSLNGRLKKFGLRSVLVKNFESKLFILLVESSKESFFYEYLDLERLTIVQWLDEDCDNKP